MTRLTLTEVRSFPAGPCKVKPCPVRTVDSVTSVSSDEQLRVASHRARLVNQLERFITLPGFCLEGRAGRPVRRCGSGQ